ncbi:uncharacterized protein LOC130957241 [Arachis stenosperma]|uniref:uncharacterized protein LOC130957241 n=1 Tax=Arachis stenosperma TaxID=217475 RepID=UPI0025ABE607|nr:uncharacterized protein LOC130957241 [Arachis stenosperma]
MGSGAGVIIESNQGTQVELSLKFGFPASNNQAEYEALLAGLKLAGEVGARKLNIYSDSQVVISQIIGSYQAKDPVMKRYLVKTKQQLEQLEEYKICHIPPNGQAEAANKVILAGLKRRLQNAKGAWAEELPQVLWAYRTTPHSTTKESPFRLTYGTEAMIPVEIEEGSHRAVHYNEGANSQLQREELDLLPEIQERARIREEALKRQMAFRYNQRVVPRSFTENDLILIRNDIGTTQPREGKLAANWKGPYRVIKVLGKGYYRVSELDGRELPRYSTRFQDALF